MTDVYREDGRAIPRDLHPINGYRNMDLTESVYRRLARRLFVSEQYAKYLTYMLGYGGIIDPWIEHLYHQEMDALVDQERQERFDV